MLSSFAFSLLIIFPVGISAIGIFDDYVHTMMDSYSKMLSQVNSAMDKTSEKAEKKDSAKV